MKKIPLPALVLCLLMMMTSCQKEIDWNLQGNTDSTATGTSGTLLVKAVAVSNGETQETDYTYDNAKRLSTITITGTSGGMAVNSFQQITRDASGRITLIAQKMGDVGGVATDTSYTYVYYPNATTKSYSYTIATTGFSGFTTSDSTAYTFNSSGQVTESASYLSTPLYPSLNYLTTKWQYTYDASGDMVTMKIYNDLQQTGDLVLTGTYALTYDDKVSPLVLDEQGILLGYTQSSSPHNINTFAFTNVSDTSTSFTLSFNDQYGADGKPTSGLSVQQPGGTVTNYTFYYQ